MSPDPRTKALQDIRDVASSTMERIVILADLDGPPPDKEAAKQALTALGDAIIYIEDLANEALKQNG